MHYERKRKGRPVGSAKPLRRRCGEGSVNNGYIIITVDGRQMMQHRYFMEQLLGRPLTREETVHHVNGDRSDNATDGPLRGYRSGNLELWSHAQPPGQHVLDKVEYAIKILEMYAPVALAAQLPLPIDLPAPNGSTL